MTAASQIRAAIYFTPPAGDRLTRTASEWLGRNAFSGEETRAPDTWRDPLVADAARYGFHATIRAPFRPAPGCDIADIDERLAAFAASRSAFVLQSVEIARLGRFFALVPTAPSTGLAELEASVLDAFEPYRAPITPVEIARRRPEQLTENQRENLFRWGYPSVLADFRFHMTLTGKVPDEEASKMKALLDDTFCAFIGQPLAISGLALFIEPAPGAPFKVHSFHEFSKSAEASGAGY